MFGSNKKTATKVGTLNLQDRFSSKNPVDPHEYDDVLAETERHKAQREETGAKEPVPDKEPGDIASPMEKDMFASFEEQIGEAPCEAVKETNTKAADDDVQFVVPEGAEFLGTREEVAEAFAAAALNAPKTAEEKNEESFPVADDEGEIEYVDAFDGEDEPAEEKTDKAGDDTDEGVAGRAALEEKGSEPEAGGKETPAEDEKLPIQNNDFLDSVDEAGYELPDDEAGTVPAEGTASVDAAPDKDKTERRAANEPNAELQNEPVEKSKKNDKKRKPLVKDDEDATGLSGLLDGESRKVVLSRFDRAFADGKKIAGTVFESEQAMEKFITEVLGVKKTMAEGYYGGYKFRAIMPPVAVSGATISFEAYPKEKATLDDMFGYDVITKEALEFLGREIENGESVIVVGKSGTGRTSLLERLCVFVQSNDAFFASVEEDRTEIDFKDKDVLKAVASTEYKITSEELIREFMSQGVDTLVVGEINRQNAKAAYALLKNKVQLLACALGDAETAGKLINTVGKNADMKNADFADAFENGCIVVNIKQYAGKVYKVNNISKVGKDAQDDSRIRFDAVFSRKNGDLVRTSERGEEE